MEITQKQVAELRAETGVGIMECKKALVEAGGNFDEASKILPKKGAAASGGQGGPATCEGVVGVGGVGDIGGGRDSPAGGWAVAGGPWDPGCGGRSGVTAEILGNEGEIARAKATAAGKPANVVERIAEGKVEKFYQEMVLTEQAFVKDPEKTVGQVLIERGGKEALELRFVRFKLGEASARTPSEGEALAS